ncbi:hypothetical protein QG37_03773 [Candidozyma auris]|uniref:Uncharacterized protein n=1 Tax=Candidozyma auris TaxID=498019 RepID=A0A0L0NYY9_CANAR|nr:hypothetical protein QG37_03773 [[Candida] auris]
MVVTSIILPYEILRSMARLRPHITLVGYFRVICFQKVHSEAPYLKGISGQEAQKTLIIGRDGCKIWVRFLVGRRKWQICGVDPKRVEAR